MKEIKKLIKELLKAKNQASFEDILFNEVRDKEIGEAIKTVLWAENFFVSAYKDRDLFGQRGSECSLNVIVRLLVAHPLNEALEWIDLCKDILFVAEIIEKRDDISEECLSELVKTYKDIQHGHIGVSEELLLFEVIKKTPSLSKQRRKVFIREVFKDFKPPKHNG